MIFFAVHKKAIFPCVCVCGAGGLGLVAFETAAFGALKWGWGVIRRKILGLKRGNKTNSFKGCGSLLHHTIHLRAIILLKTAWFSSLGVPANTVNVLSENN